MRNDSVLNAIEQMRICTSRAERNRVAAIARRAELKEEIKNRRERSDNSKDVIYFPLERAVDFAIKDDLRYKSFVSDNQWYIQQSIMWANIAQTEMRYWEFVLLTEGQ